MYKAAVEGKEKALGKEQLSTLRSVNNLTLVLRDRGQYEAAEEMIGRAVDGREKAPEKITPTRGRPSAANRQQPGIGAAGAEEVKSGGEVGGDGEDEATERWT